MFDPAIAYNQLPFLPPDFEYNQIDILKALNAANTALAELKGQSFVLPNVAVLLHPLLIRESMESSEIENIHTTLESVLQSEQISEKNRSKADKEVLNYRKSMLRGYQILKEQGFLNTNGIIEMQSLLEPNKSGIRKVPVSIRDTIRDAIIYTPPTGETLLRDLLQNLEAYFNSTEKEPDALIKMAAVHYQFEAIHPFLDGNGRTGRMLMVLYLVAQKKLDYPLLFLSGYINAHKKTYYQLLREIPEKNNWKEWILFLLTAVQKQALETSRKILEIQQLIIQQKSYWKHAYSSEFIELFFQQPFISQSVLAREAGITRQTASKRLALLEKSGTVQSVQKGKIKLYYLPEFLAILA